MDPLYIVSNDISLLQGGLGYGYVAGDPVGSFDPSGELWIKPAPPPQGFHLGTLHCGETAYVHWLFGLQTKRRGSRKPGAPCEGFLVQKVNVICGISSCRTGRGITPGNECLTYPFLSYSYFEAWYVQRGRPISNPPKHAAWTDEASFASERKTCGVYEQFGALRFYCMNRWGNNVGIGDLRTTWNPPDWWYPNPTDSCRTTAGGVVSTDDPTLAQFWSQPWVRSEGSISRDFSLEWTCCDCVPKRFRQAYATANPPDEPPLSVLQ